MIPTPRQAYELLQQYNQGEFHLKHGSIVGDVMRWFAQELGYGEEADFWQAVGILHDLDFERWPEEHCVKSQELMREKVGPVLATRDFNLIPAMLKQRFKLAADKMDFPPVERRRELSDPDQPHGDTLTALLCREGLLPFAEAIAAAKRLAVAARLGAVICCAGSLLGLVLAAYLTSIGAYTSLSTLSLLVYLLTWLAPVWFLSGWAHRF